MVWNQVNFKGVKKGKLLDSVTAMGPKINRSNMAELVKLEVEKTVETQKNELLEVKKMFKTQLDRAHELLLGAMARITCLENEINKYHQNTCKHSTSSSSSLPQGRVPSSASLALGCAGIG